MKGVVAIAVILFSTLLLALPGMPQTGFSTFGDWCLNQPQLAPEAQHTVSTLLAIAGTSSCAEAALTLSGMTTLDLTDQGISDLSPLSSLTHLTILRLGQNQIVNLEPLASMTALNSLYLPDNKITNIEALSELNQLQTLYLDGNQIRDIRALSNLRSLQTLYLNYNQISTLEPIAGLPHLEQLFVVNNRLQSIESLSTLSQLTYLNLGGNQITSVAPLASLTNLIELGLQGNLIEQLIPLQSLSQTNKIDLRNNPLASKVCPVFPATICIFTDDAAALFQAGETQLQQGEFEAAIASFQQALSIYEGNGDRLRDSDARDRIGNAYDELGQYANSLAWYQQAAAVRQASGDRQGESATLTNLGITYIRLGQTDKAIAALTEALAIEQTLTVRERSWLRPTPPQGIIFNGLALAYSRSGDKAQALRFAKRSLARYRQNTDPVGEVMALTQVGTAYLNLGNVDKARLYLDRALVLSERQGDRPGKARSLKALGDFAARTDDSELAATRYQQALRLYESLGDVASQGQTLNALGALLLATDQPAAAAAVLFTTVDLWESLRPGLTDENKISLADTQTETYRLLQRSLLQASPPETNQDGIATSLEVSERGRARAFAELLGHRLALQGETPPPASLAPPQIDQIRQIAQAQNATLVEYAIVGDSLYIWVVQPNGRLHFKEVAISEQAIAAAVSTTRTALGVPVRGLGVTSIDNGGQSRAIAVANESLRQLHRLLIEPIAALLPPDPTATVVIIPQGELFLVPFPALLDAQNTALVEQHPLLFAPAISLLTPTPPTADVLTVRPEEALIVGNPVMPPDPNTGVPLPPLYGSEIEALEIATLLDTEPLIGASATKATVVATMPKAKIIHLATHGLLDDFGTGVPGILALTPTTDDGGFLTATEILALPLQAQLAVLSACNTGQGKITGDGVVGLSRSLLTAGVDNVMVTLWAIPDVTTAVLMAAFYTELAQTPNRAIALQRAMLTTRATYDNPLNWSAFSLYGRSVNHREGG